MEVFSSNGKEKRNGDSAEDPSITMLTVVKSPALFPLDGNGRKRREKEKRRVMEKDRIGEREREREREKERCGTGGQVTRGFASLTNSFIPGGSALVRHNPSICRRGVSRVMLLLAASCRL